MAIDNLHKGAGSELFYFARQNRKASTEAENILWNHLRARRLRGFKFRRQHPLADFIADFYCMQCNLIVEIDGGYHNQRDQEEYDRGSGRTYLLNELGIRVIRFTNEEVIERTGFVLKAIERHLIPGPSPQGEE
jgi:very-short-patch-repair endonuclease